MVALRIDIEEAMEAIGHPPVLSLNFVSPETAEAEFDKALRQYRRDLMQWRSSILSILPAVEKAFVWAQDNGGDKLLRQMIADVMPRVRRHLEASIERAEANKTPPLEVQRNFDFAATLGPEIAAIVRSARSKYDRAIHAYLSSLLDFQERLDVLEWDYDPDSRGGNTFDNVDDLLASLKA